MIVGVGVVGEDAVEALAQQGERGVLGLAPAILQACG